MKFNLPYGKEHLEVNIPDERINAVINSKLDDYAAPRDQGSIVRKAMEQPIGSEPLEVLARGKNNVVILASDHTRPVPSKIIIPLMLQKIRKGNPGADVTILIATGSHRGTTHEELVQKFGEEIVKNEKILVHDCVDEQNLVSVGTLPSGGELILNKLAVEADLLVSEGFIEPHFFAGYSGGRKSVMPGIASRKTVHANHCSAFIADEHSRCGILDGNPIHRDMIYAARKAKLAFIVNVVINSNKEIIGAFAGDCDEAHREGAAFLDKMCRSTPVFSNIVIVTNNGYPLDQNIYQSVKGMTTAEATCNEGGVIIMVAKCEDGCGGEAFHRTFLENPSAEKLLEQFLTIPANETIPDQWQSQIFARILIKHKVILVSGLDDKLVSEMHLIPAKSVVKAIAVADRILGNTDCKITVIPEGISNIIA